MAKVIPISERVLFGESPFWDSKRGKLIFTDAFGKSVCQYDPLIKEIITKKVVWEDSAAFSWISLAMPYEDDLSKFLVTTSTGKILEFDWNKENITKELLSSCDPYEFFSDGKCDSKGRLWNGAESFSVPTSNLTASDIGVGLVVKDSGTLCCYNVDDTGHLRRAVKERQFDGPNGLAWNVNYDKLYWNDLCKGIIVAFDFVAESGELGGRKELFNFQNHPELKGCYPDGLVADLNGDVWTACWGGGCVIKVDATTGQLLEKIDLPVDLTTSLCFGGGKFQEMFVTTSSVTLTGESVITNQPESGKLFRITKDQDNSFRGFQEHFFRP